MMYEGIYEGETTGLSVCQGLHTATRQLRDSWLGLKANIRPAKLVDDVKNDNGKGAMDAGQGLERRWITEGRCAM